MVKERTIANDNIIRRIKLYDDAEISMDHLTQDNRDINMRKEPKFKKISFKEFSLAKHVNTKLHKSIIRSKKIKAP